MSMQADIIITNPSPDAIMYSENPVSEIRDGIMHTGAPLETIEIHCGQNTVTLIWGRPGAISQDILSVESLMRACAQVQAALNARLRALQKGE